MCNDKNAYSYMYTILLYWYIKWKNMMWKHIREENTYDYDIMKNDLRDCIHYNIYQLEVLY